MSRNGKIIVMIVLAFGITCALGCVALTLLVPRLMSNAVAADPATKKRIAQGIADYTLPPGYTEAIAMDLALYQIVGISPEDEEGMDIMLMQMMTADYDREQMERQLRQSFAQQYGRSNLAMRNVGERTVSIKNRPTVLAIAENETTSPELRQATGVFTGKKGLVMLMVTGNVADWDWKLLERFLASIR